MVDEEFLSEAWYKICEFVKYRTSEMSASDTKEYLDFLAFYIGTSRKSIDRWIENGLPRTVFKNSASSSAIRRLYSYVSKSENGNWRLAEAIGGALQLKNSDFGHLLNYEGDFSIFRKGKTELIEGRMTITNANGDEPWMHYHESLQDGVLYRHQGPIYHYNGRIYMLGVGVTDIEKYFRPMIFKVQDHPHTSVTFGILLTELSESYKPLSAKVALVSRKDRRVDDPEFREVLDQRLKIESDTNVIYGEQATRL
ncbi:hypothetical protein [Roseobacter sp. S98]|uniref:hypothetical protein n=1 Tax=Roseobacter algicola (ex Choi et al. 2025) (nom. illeg.) TaxID=3092138 RepID=UPI0035C69C08